MFARPAVDGCVSALVSHRASIAPVSGTNRIRAAQSSGWRLLPENFFDVADFILDFATDFLGCAAIFHVGIAGGASSFFFHRAFSLVDLPFDFVFCARVHTNDSRTERVEVVRVLTQLRKQENDVEGKQCGHGDGKRFVEPLVLRQNPGDGEGGEGDVKGEVRRIG